MNLSKQSEHLCEIVDTIANKIIADKNISKCTYKFPFNTKDLPDRITVDKNDYSIKGFETLFNDLDKKKNHCLYWFEINQENKRYVLLNMLNNYRAKKERTVPASATKKVYCDNSHVFYVGVRRGYPNPNSNQQHSNICRRIYQHLGYYHTAKTQNPQLLLRVSLRRKRDSNPRRCDPQQFSRLPHSTTLPFLLECLISYLLNADANIERFFYSFK